MKDSTTKVKIVIKKNWKKGSKNKENMRRTHALKMETNMKKGRKWTNIKNENYFFTSTKILKAGKKVWLQILSMKVTITLCFK